MLCLLDVLKCIQGMGKDKKIQFCLRSAVIPMDSYKVLLVLIFEI